MNSSKLSTFASLRIPNFRLFWVALFAAHVGFQMQNVAINWHMYEITKSPVSLGLIGLITFLPLLAFSLPAGIVADRFPRKKVMLISQLTNFSAAAILSITSFTGFTSPILIYCIIAIHASVVSFDLPSRQAMLPSLVPEKYFKNAVGLATLIRQTAIIVGPAVAGFLIEFIGVRTVYMVNTGIFLFAMGTILFIHTNQQKKNIQASFNLASINEGINFVRHTPIIYSTMLLDFFATFFSAATVLLPIFAKDILAIGPRGLGFLYAAPSAGAVLAGLLFSSISIGTSGKVLVLSVMAYGLATIGFGLSKSFPLSIFFLFLAGAGDMVSTIIRNTLRQLITPDHLRGRMVAINMVFFAGGPQLGEAEAGFLAAGVGAPISVVIGGFATLILTIFVATKVPKLWNYEASHT